MGRNFRIRGNSLFLLEVPEPEKKWINFKWKLSMSEVRTETEAKHQKLSEAHIQE
jgi:hypothetical protein